jgi:hypothetical protein
MGRAAALRSSIFVFAGQVQIDWAIARPAHAETTAAMRKIPAEGCGVVTVYRA